MTLLLEFAGAIIILIPFALSLVRRMSTRSAAYLWLNLVGSALLSWVAWVGSQWGFVLVQIVWALVAARGLLRLRPASRDAGSQPPAGH